MVHCDRPPVLFALAPDGALGVQVAVGLGCALAPHEERSFEDGEHKCRPLESVRGRDAYVLHSLYGDAERSVNDKLCRMLFFIGALRDAGAERITAVAPCLAYARKDRRSKPRDPVTTRYVARLFEAVGADAVVTLDVHNLAAFENAFRIRTEHLEATRPFAERFAADADSGPLCVVAPDAGAVKRAAKFAAALGKATGADVGAAFMEKHRSAGVVSGSAFVGEVRGAHAIVFDDLISTGGTIMRTAERCRALGARRVSAAATHGLFVGGDALLRNEAIDEVVVTDSVRPFRLAGSPAIAKLQILSIAPLLAAAIGRLHVDGSLTELSEI